MKIGIMGGTFDPIHNGHLMLGIYARDLFQLDEIWFMPNGTPPHKSSDSIESLTKHRVEMVKRAIENEDSFKISLYEIERKEVNYSYLTMEHFREEYPEHQFYFIIGADSLFAIEKWKNPERLLKTCTILAAYRDGRKQEEMEEQIVFLNRKYDADIRLLNTPNVDISSTNIRDRLKNGEDIRDAVPTGVFEYIEEYDVFGQRFELAKIKVKKVQSESRFSHTLGVIDTATSLAIQYGVDVEKAKWAALLHDCAKPFSTNLLHAKEGAILAKKEYSVDDPMILDAIAYHTTGRPKMTLLEKIIYVADYIEPNRNKAPNLEILRQVAFKDLNRCVCMIAEASLHYLKSSGESNIDPLTEQTYTYYKERM